MASDDGDSQHESVWQRMEAEEADRLGRLPVDDYYDRHPWLRLTVGGAFLVVLVVALAVGLWWLAEAVLVGFFGGIATRYMLRSEGRRRRRNSR